VRAAFCDDAEVLIGLADIRSARGLTDEASVLLEEALDQLRVFGRGTIQAEHKRAWAVENLGLVRRRQGRWRDVVELHTWSLSAFGELADRFGNAHAEANLGDAYSAGRKSQAALAHYQRALDLFTKLNHPWGQAWAHKSLGQLRLARRKWLQADQEFRRSHELYRLAGDVTRRREVLQTRAATLRHAGRPEDAATCEREEAGLSDPASEGSAQG
jgi:tetratricopeptide (TPR) repeat protein